MPKISGLYWNPETGKGVIRKQLRGEKISRRFSASSRAEAEAIYYQVIATPRVSKANERTFRSAAIHYLETESKRSLDRDATCIANLDPFIGRLALDQVHQGTLAGYIEKRRADGIKSGTVARELSVVRRILTLASRLWRDEDGKPWLAGETPLIRLPKWGDRKRPYPLTGDEQRRLLNELPDHLALMALFGLNTGARENVICNLKWEWEIRVPEIERSVFLAPGEFTKNGTDCLIPISRRAEVIIDGLRGQHDTYVFTYKGQPTTRINNSAWRKAWKRAGLPTDDSVLSGPHNLRHTFARRLRLAMVPQVTIKALMHHIDGDVTVNYAPAELEELFRAVDSLPEPKVLLRAVS